MSTNPSNPDTPKPALPEPDDDDVAPPKVTGSPERIWLVYGDIERDDTHGELARHGDVGWCEDKQFDSDVEYVRADLMLAAIDAAVAEARAVPNGLARGLLWLAYVWNDHNFEPAHTEARRIAAKAGINSFEEANAWLAAPSPAAPARVAMSDEQWGIVARVGFDDYWDKCRPGTHAKAWQAAARAVVAEYERANGIGEQP